MSRSKIIPVIDVGSSKITTIIAQYFPDQEQINVIGSATFDSRGIKRGQIVDIEEATEAITRSVEVAERMAGYSISEATVAISAPHVSSINSAGVVAVADPQGEITPDDVERVVEAARAISLPASAEIIHVIPRQFTVDGQGDILDPVGMSGVRLEVETHIVVSSSPAIKNLTRCINEVGIDINGLVYSGFAAAEAVLTDTERELGIILIDLGGSVTTITVFTESFPAFVKVLPLGARKITDDLAIGLRLPLEQAEKLKLYLSKTQESDSQGNHRKQKLEKKREKKEKAPDEIDLKKVGIFDEEGRKVSRMATIDGIIKPRLDELFSLVKDEIRESGLGGATPAGVVLTGGGALTIGAKKSCQKILGLPVRIGEPKETNGLVDDIMNPAYASALGLIDYVLKNDLSKGGGPAAFDILKFKNRLKIGGAATRIVEAIKSFLP
jgi:cell division protein FtsA